MNIHNIRLGFATNSSSSHSIVIVPKDGHKYSSVSPNWEHYGWDNFVLVSPEDKMDYLAYQVTEWIRNNIGYELAVPIIKSWYDIDLPEDEGDFYGVDHQSHISFPLSLETGRLDIGFLRELEELLRQDNVVILGGNDNGSPPDATYSSIIPGELEENYSPLYSVKVGRDWWTIFNTDSGAKIRISLVDDPSPLKYAYFPELVDMKITDFCPFDCLFCYQGSTRNGEHAKTFKIYDYLEQLSGKTFEVTFGGGEPTLHPDFISILKKCKNFRIVPNFTTKIMPDRWSTEFLEAVKEFAGNFAVSAEDREGIEKLGACNKLYGLKGVAHFVVGAYPKYRLAEIIESAYFHKVHVTLLGFKTTGRGKTFKEIPQDMKPELFERSWYISVDTAFLDKYKDVLDKMGVSETLRVSGEGTFSMYIDAVSEKAGISSYHLDTLIDYDTREDKLEDIWFKLDKY